MKSDKKFNWTRVAKWLGIIGLAILFSVIMWIVFDKSYFGLFRRIDSKIASELGGFIAGFVGIFWTAAGVILIYSTFNEQKELYEKQQFESTFFSLINTYHNLVINTKGKVGQSNNNTCGRPFFSAVLDDFRFGLKSDEFKRKLCRSNEIPEVRQFLEGLGKTPENMEMLPKPEYEIDEIAALWMLTDVSKEFIIAQYEFFYEKYQSQLGYIFRYLYNIFKFTIRERENHGDEKRYIDLIQAQLSSDELSLLFYNALSHNARSSKGEYNFHRWLDDFNFFENVDKNSLLREEHKRFYPNTRFKF